VSKCNHCNKEMTDPKVTTCTANTLIHYSDGLEAESIPSICTHCSDCGVAYKGNHHPGCEMEVCPRCGDMLVDCGCDNIEEPVT